MWSEHTKSSPKESNAGRPHFTQARIGASAWSKVIQRPPASPFPWPETRKHGRPPYGRWRPLVLSVCKTFLGLEALQPASLRLLERCDPRCPSRSGAGTRLGACPVYGPSQAPQSSAAEYEAVRPRPVRARTRTLCAPGRSPLGRCTRRPPLEDARLNHL